MKKLLFIAFVFNCIVLNAQTKIEEPEFSGNVVYVNDSIGSGIRLETQTASIKTNANGMAYVPVIGIFAGKATSKNAIQGVASSVQIDKRIKVQFIVKVSDNSIDPVTVINVFKLKVEKNKRTIDLASASALGSSKSGDIAYLTFQGKKYGKSSYLLTIDTIEPGEYAITLANRRDIFNLFGVK
jgi:hypothetical protein